MIGSANGIVANAYSGNMKKNVDEDAEGDEEAITTAKDRLVRAYSASNLLIPSYSSFLNDYLLLFFVICNYLADG